jgi:hypothetical protein
MTATQGGDFWEKPSREVPSRAESAFRCSPWSAEVGHEASNP